MVGRAAVQCCLLSTPPSRSPGTKGRAREPANRRGKGSPRQPACVLVSVQAAMNCGSGAGTIDNPARLRISAAHMAATIGVEGAALADITVPNEGNPGCVSRSGTESLLTCMGVFLSSGFWFVAGSLFGAEKPFLVPSPALRFAERAEGVKGPKC